MLTHAKTPIVGLKNSEAETVFSQTEIELKRINFYRIYITIFD